MASVGTILIVIGLVCFVGGMAGMVFCMVEVNGFTPFLLSLLVFVMGFFLPLIGMAVHSNYTYQDITIVNGTETHDYYHVHMGYSYHNRYNFIDDEGVKHAELGTDIVYDTNTETGKNPNREN